MSQVLFSTLLELQRDPAAAERPRVISVISALLERVVVRNERHHHQPSSQLNNKAAIATVFHGLRAPTISIHRYLERIFKYANCSPACFVVAYAYIDRFIRQQPDVAITSLNIHRLLITSVMIAAKFLDDAYYNNAYYAKVGGVTTLEMNRLELQFLFHLDFRLQVTVSVFESYCTHLEREVACCGGYHVQSSVQLCCGLDHQLHHHAGSSAQLNPDKLQHQQQPQQQQQQQQQIIPLRCSYAGL